MNVNMVKLQDEIAKWRLQKTNDEGWLFPDDAVVCAKAGEELGEFIRAVFGKLENRPDRGDPLQEAAQTILVLMSYFGFQEEPYDLMQALVEECQRLGVNVDAATES